MSAEWFPGRLRELRAAAGLTQADLAERAGVHRDAVARWEAGRREPSWSNVIALASALGVDCLAFLEEPSNQAKARPGRPKKTTVLKTAPETPKRRGKKK